MRNTIGIFVSACVALALADAAWSDGLQDDVDQATSIIQRFREIPETSIPDAVLRQAKGLAIMTVVKAGFLASAQGGKGVVIARTDSGWSGPSAIGTGGGGFGFQIGAAVTEFVIVLNTPGAVAAFEHQGNVTVGADVSVVAGPLGRDASASVMPVAAIYTYSVSQGLFAGMSLQGAVFMTRDDANREYYGRAVTPAQILSGKVTPPHGAEELIDALKKF